MHPISEILCEIYENLLKKGEVFFPITEEQKQKLDSTVKTVNADYFGYQPYPTPKDKAAAYFVYIIKDHDVTDGNKRLALMWLEIYTEVHKLKLNLPEKVGLDELAVAVENVKTDHHELISILKIVLFSGK